MDSSTKEAGTGSSWDRDGLYRMERHLDTLSSELSVIKAELWCYEICEEGRSAVKAAQRDAVQRCLFLEVQMEELYEKVKQKRNHEAAIEQLRESRSHRQRLEEEILDLQEQLRKVPEMTAEEEISNMATIQTLSRKQGSAAGAPGSTVQVQTGEQWGASVHRERQPSQRFIQRNEGLRHQSRRWSKALVTKGLEEQHQRLKDEEKALTEQNKGLIKTHSEMVKRLIVEEEWIYKCHVAERKRDELVQENQQLKEKVRDKQGRRCLRDLEFDFKTLSTDEKFLTKERNSLKKEVQMLMKQEAKEKDWTTKTDSIKVKNEALSREIRQLHQKH
ncbi:hypothetical protein D5F01_LYC24458 [Larimichthys crocea]|uniref:Uncharacterized protein n=1 Tax=Larimichthys crocea TaxID=215358 RepID=A0A6G0HEG3_LARCR|nr:hypothetical protein D5F01_LYC24458 [Larimichthys crocea]